MLDLRNKQKGFTLAELLVSLGLLGVIAPIVMSFFITSLKNYESINNRLELQFQAQYILDFMSDKILESRYIELARENIVSLLKKTNEQNITKISFRYGDNVNQCYNFEINKGKIKYGNARSNAIPTDELGIYVKNLTATPINGEQFEDTNAIIIKITLEKGSQIYEAEQMMYMRNYEMK